MEEENGRLRCEVAEAAGRTEALEVEVQREAEFNASLEAGVARRRSRSGERGEVD